MHVLRRIDPTPGQLREALDEAFRRAAQAVAVDLDTPSWDALVEQSALPEGVFARPYHIDWQRGRIDVVVAWWGDPIGRRHWHIACAAVTGLPPGDTLAEMGWGPAPAGDDHPLAHIAPPLSFLWRVAGQRREPFVVCRCGFAGSPASLAWMGEMCGPCFDREQEGLPALGIDPWRRDLGPFDRFLLAPDGRLVTFRFGAWRSGAQVGLPVTVRVWVPPYVGKPIWGREWSNATDWAAACNRRHLALLFTGRLTLVSLDEGRTSDSRAMPELAGPAALAFAGLEGARLLGLCEQKLRAWSVDEGGRIGAEPLYRADVAEPLGELHVSPLGQRVLVPGMSVRETATGAEIERLTFADRSADTLAFAPDGAVLATGGPWNYLGVTPPQGDDVIVGRWPDERRGAGSGLWGWLRGRKPREPAAVGRIEEGLQGPLAASPCGKAFVLLGKGVRDETVILVGDAHTMRVHAVLTLADRGGPRDVAFTADGRDLLFLTSHGLAVYPWRELAGLK
jgi:hypothetical protein